MLSSLLDLKFILKLHLKVKYPKLFVSIVNKNMKNAAVLSVEFSPVVTESSPIFVSLVSIRLSFVRACV